MQLLIMLLILVNFNIHSILNLQPLLIEIRIYQKQHLSHWVEKQLHPVILLLIVKQREIVF